MNIPGWSQLDEEQRALVEWQYRLCGDFKMALWKTIALADDSNLERLKSAFPLQVDAFLKYATITGYWAKTVKLAGGDVEAGY